MESNWWSATAQTHLRETLKVFATRRETLSAPPLTDLVTVQNNLAAATDAWAKILDAFTSFNRIIEDSSATPSQIVRLDDIYVNLKDLLKTQEDTELGSQMLAPVSELYGAKRELINAELQLRTVEAVYQRPSRRDLPVKINYERQQTTDRDSK